MATTNLQKFRCIENIPNTCLTVFDGGKESCVYIKGGEVYELLKASPYYFFTLEHYTGASLQCIFSEKDMERYFRKVSEEVEEKYLKQYLACMGLEENFKEFVDDLKVMEKL